MIGLLASRKLILKPGHTILGYQSLHQDAGRGRFSDHTCRKNDM